MSIKIKKKALKIIGIVIVAIIILVGLFFLIQTISTNMKIKETEEKLSQINTEELKTKLIEGLEKTDLNIDLTLDTMFVDTIFTEGEDELEGFTVMSIIAFKNNSVIGGIEIPCFKIESDSNGNFKNIEYVYNRPLDTNIIAQTIRNVFKDTYNIDFTITNKTKYNTTFNQYFVNKGTITTVSDDFFLAIVNRINDTEYEDYSLVEDYKEYETAKFGLELEETEINTENGGSASQTLTQEQKEQLILAALEDRLNEKVNKGDLLNMYIKEYDNYDRFLVYSYITSTQATTNPDSTLKTALSSSEYDYMYYLTKNIYKNRIYIGVISLKSQNGQYNLDLDNPYSIVSYDYETFVNAQNGSDATSEKTYLNSAEKEAERMFTVAKNEVNWNQPKDSISNEDNNTNQSENITNGNYNNITDNSNNQKEIKDGTYNKVLTSTEKDNGNISLGDINFEIKGNTIMFSDNSSQIVLKGTYTIEDNKLVGTYTKATYYSYEQLDFVTETVEDPFEFEIREDNTLYDTMGYGQFLGKCLYRNATYELVE